MYSCTAVCRTLRLYTRQSPTVLVPSVGLTRLTMTLVDLPEALRLRARRSPVPLTQAAPVRLTMDEDSAAQTEEAGGVEEIIADLEAQKAAALAV